MRLIGGSTTASQAQQASKDYKIYFVSTSHIDEGTVDDDTIASLNRGNNCDDHSFSDAIIDGIQSNPYMAWEWGMVARRPKLQ